MIRAEGFDAVFARELQHHESPEKTFHHLNKQYQTAFGYPRYRTYESYRIARSGRLAKGNKVTG
jgi:hypothetical protein